MTMLHLDTATPADVDDLAARITEADAAELAAAGHTVHDCLAGAQAQALRMGADLVCLFGVVRHPTSARAGIPWMLCTQTLSKVPRRAMADVSRRVVEGWRRDHDALSNLVHRRNQRAVRFVRWLGFTVGTVPCGPGQEFLVFEWRRDV